jgi:hypothetical protein
MFSNGLRAFFLPFLVIKINQCEKWAMSLSIDTAVAITI